MCLALFAPLEMSPSSLQFNVEPQCVTFSKVLSLSNTLCNNIPRIFHCFQCFCCCVHSLSWQNVELKAVGAESACWRAVTAECVLWWFDCSGTSVLAQGAEEQKLCVVSPSSGSLRPGQAVCLEITIIPDVVRMGRYTY